MRVKSIIKSLAEILVGNTPGGFQDNLDCLFDYHTNIAYLAISKAGNSAVKTAILSKYVDLSKLTGLQIHCNIDPAKVDQALKFYQTRRLSNLEKKYTA